MAIFINNKSTKFCQIALCIKRFIDKREAVPFFLPHDVEGGSVAEWLAGWTQAQKGPGSNRSRDAVG